VIRRVFIDELPYQCECKTHFCAPLGTLEIRVPLARVRLYRG